jgi:hypothetical protein
VRPQDATNQKHQTSTYQLLSGGPWAAAASGVTLRGWLGYSKVQKAASCSSHPSAWTWTHSSLPPSPGGLGDRPSLLSRHRIRCPDPRLRFRSESGNRYVAVGEADNPGGEDAAGELDEPSSRLLLRGGVAGRRDKSCAGSLSFGTSTEGSSPTGGYRLVGGEFAIISSSRDC